MKIGVNYTTGKIFITFESGNTTEMSAESANLMGEQLIVLAEGLSKTDSKEESHNVSQ